MPHQQVILATAQDDSRSNTSARYQSGGLSLRTVSSPSLNSSTLRTLSIWIPAAILAIALYAITIRGTLVWDDRFIASADPRLHDVSGWRLFFIQAYRPNAVDNLWRPLTSLSYWVQWRMGGAAWALHLFNIIVHAGASALVALLGYRLAGRKAGLIAGLLFAAHPAHVEGVAYLVGRAGSLCALFGSGAL